MRLGNLFKSLYFQVLLAIIAGILLGKFYPGIAVQFKPLGDGFIKLIKMTIAPVVFCTIVTGIAGMKDLKKLGRVGLKAVVYFEVVSTIALIIGLIIVNVIKPGAGMHVDVSLLDVSKIPDVKVVENKGPVAFLLHMIPDNIVAAFANGELLQVLFFATIFGIALSKIGLKSEPLVKVLQSFSDGLFQLIHFIMRLAPIGAFGAMAYTIGQFGIGTLQSLGQLIITFYLTCFIFIILVLGGILKGIGFNIFKLLKFIRRELMIVIGTSSSESALPGLIEKLEKVGCSKPIVGLVVPTGYSFNLDGTAIYLTMAAVFLAQAIDVPLTIGHQVYLLLVLLLLSKGAAGVTGSGFITLAAVLPTMENIPLVAITLILGIDRFMSEARAVTNIIGNAVATIVISKWEGELDEDQSVCLK